MQCRWRLPWWKPRSKRPPRLYLGTCMLQFCPKVDSWIQPRSWLILLFSMWSKCRAYSALPVAVLRRIQMLWHISTVIWNGLSPDYQPAEFTSWRPQHWSGWHSSRTRTSMAHSPWYSHHTVWGYASSERPSRQMLCQHFNRIGLYSSELPVSSISLVQITAWQVLRVDLSYGNR